MEKQQLDLLLTIIDSGQMSGSNKMSTLLALIDLVPQLPPNSLEVKIADIADKVVELSWTHLDSYHGHAPLKQLTSGNRDALVAHKVVKSLREIVGHQARYHTARKSISRGDWDAQLRPLIRSLKSNPLKLLQNVKGAKIEFLYPLDFSGNTVKLFPSAKELLLQFGPSLRVLIEARYIQFVARINMGELEYSRIENYLFGSERFMPSLKLRQELLELQGGKCVLTGSTLRKDKKSLAVDHFVPWSMTRISELQNLTLTSTRINTLKSNYLPDLEVVDAWLEFQFANQSTIIALGEKHNWPADFKKAANALSSLFMQASSGIPVFSMKGIKVLSENRRTEILKKLVIR